jgi:hypothetical protein
VTAPIPNTPLHSTAAAWCNAEQQTWSASPAPAPGAPAASSGQWSASALVIPGGADSRVAVMHSLIAGVLPSHCGRETGGERRDMILQCPANYAATHAHRARLSRSSLMAN